MRLLADSPQRGTRRGIYVHGIWGSVNIVKRAGSDELVTVDEEELDTVVIVCIKSPAARRFKVWLKEAAVARSKTGVDTALPDAGRESATDNQGVEAPERKALAQKRRRRTGG